MDGQRQPTDEQLLVLGGIEAIESMMWHLQGKQFFYILTPTLYTQLRNSEDTWMRSEAVCSEACGNRYPTGIDAFIDKALTEPNCIGLIPLTSEVQQVLTKHGLAPTKWGLRLEPEGRSYQGYGRR